MNSTSPLSLPLSPNVSRETTVNPADLIGSGMAELLGLSGVGGTLLPVSGVGVGGFGRGRDAGFSRGSGSGSVGVGVCTDTVRTPRIGTGG